jgi:hypothetical protein
MESILSYLTAFGLSTGAGTKASIPVIALGLFHHTPWFELSPRWEWIASPAVLVILTVLLVIELWADSHPEFGEIVDTIGYLPAIVAGFISFAAATGTVDSSLLQLSASGLLGSGTAVVVRGIRNRMRAPIRQNVEDLHEHAGAIATAGEAGAAAVISAASFVAPVAGAAAAGIAIVSALAIGGALGNRAVPCPHCGAPIDPRALVCAKCKGDVGR